MNRQKLLVCLLVAMHTLMGVITVSEAQTGIITTKHNLSVTGPGVLKSLTENRICIFCHTPHNATPLTPLWNKALKPTNYELYSSTTMRAPVRQPDGPSRLCLSCHDGTIALGEVVGTFQPDGSPLKIPTTGEITSGRTSYIGTALKDDHPFSFSYYQSLPNEELSQSLPFGLIFYGGGSVHCSTCHDAHEDNYPSPDKKGYLTGKFLVKDNQYSALCTTCHSSKNGWLLSSHRTSVKPVGTTFPVSPKEWPTWLTVSEWGCEGCHTPHSAGGQQSLLYYANEEEVCYLCHRGNVAQKDIYSQFATKASRHSLEIATGLHRPKESPQRISDHVECIDCHNPHASHEGPAAAPDASARLALVSGVDRDGITINSVLFEYEVCFKCHAESTPTKFFSAGFPIVRTIHSLNTRLDFETTNPSFHPVAGMRNSDEVPSIPSQDMPNLSSTSVIYCTDCHNSDESLSGGPRGPHGSRYAPILREQYITLDFTTETDQTYALCYRCHNRTSITSNISFKKHREHIQNFRAPCSTCHDPHGVNITLDTTGQTGDHTHLINFDKSIVFPAPGQTSAFFTDAGRGTGSCTLTCHGAIHNPRSY